MEHTLASRRRRFGCIAALAVIVGARYDGATLTAWGPLLPGDRQRNAHQRRGDVRTHALSGRRHSAADVTCLVTVVELPAPLRTFRRCNAGFRGRRPRVADSARKID